MGVSWFRMARCSSGTLSSSAFTSAPVSSAVCAWAVFPGEEGTYRHDSTGARMDDGHAREHPTPNNASLAMDPHLMSRPG